MTSNGVVQTWPLLLLRAEGAVIFGTSIWAYSRYSSQSWWTFAGLLLLPDLGMAGYLSPRNTNSIGAAVYNSMHTETPPVLMLCAGLVKGSERVVGLSLCWLAHIGMDRMFGFGLKYGTGFGHTHLGNAAVV